MKLPQIQKIMMEFERESEIMDMKEEMMNDAIDDVMEGDEDEEERYVYFTICQKNTSDATANMVFIRRGRAFPWKRWKP